MGLRPILLLFENEASFVLQDLALLRERYEVVPVDCGRGWSGRRAIGDLRRASASFSWFALGYAARAALWGRLLRRPSVLVSGGWDVISMPEIGYGAAQTPRGRRRARLALRNANAVLATSEWSRKTIRDLSGRDPERLYLGVDTAKWAPHGSKEDIVVTAGNVTRENFKRKGMETFVKAAAEVPDVRFVLVGKHVGDAAEVLRKISPPNVEFPGYLSDEAMVDLIARAKVYVQASYNEGFGLALAEAMAAGCVPVVTKEGSVPEVAGDAGFYVPFGDAARTGQAVREALASSRGAAASDRIQENFPLSKRRQRLHALFGELLGA